MKKLISLFVKELSTRTEFMLPFVVWGNKALLTFNLEPIEVSDVNEDSIVELLVAMASFDLKYRVYEDSIRDLPNIFVNACEASGNPEKTARLIRRVAYRLYKERNGTSARKALKIMKKTHSVETNNVCFVQVIEDNIVKPQSKRVLDLVLIGLGVLVTVVFFYCVGQIVDHSLVSASASVHQAALSSTITVAK